MNAITDAITTSTTILRQRLIASLPSSLFLRSSTVPVHFSVLGVGPEAHLLVASSCTTKGNTGLPYARLQNRMPVYRIVYPFTGRDSGPLPRYSSRLFPFSIE